MGMGRPRRRLPLTRDDATDAAPPRVLGWHVARAEPVSSWRVTREASGAAEGRSRASARETRDDGAPSHPSVLPVQGERWTVDNAYRLGGFRTVRAPGHRRDLDLPVRAPEMRHGISATAHALLLGRWRTSLPYRSPRASTQPWRAGNRHHTRHIRLRHHAWLDATWSRPPSGARLGRCGPADLAVLYRKAF
jgi:hypothetical protein